MKQHCILLVEDEEHIARAVTASLKEAGYEVYRAQDLSQGRLEAATRSPQLIILDLGLPDGDGIDLIRTVRSYSNVPIIILSARSGEDSKVTALDLGADDFIAKPFGMTELLARVRAHLRRMTNVDTTNQGSRFSFGNVTCDLTTGIVTKNNEEVHLTKLEFRLLSALIAGRGRVLTHRQLLTDVWGLAYVGHPHYLRLYMARLRQKLEDNPAFPQFFITETSMGYRLKA